MCFNQFDWGISWSNSIDGFVIDFFCMVNHLISNLSILKAWHIGVVLFWWFLNLMPFKVILIITGATLKGKKMLPMGSIYFFLK